MSELLLSKEEEEEFMAYGDSSIALIQAKKDIANLKRLLESKDAAYKDTVAKLKKDLDTAERRVVMPYTAKADNKPTTPQAKYIDLLETLVYFFAFYDDLYHDKSEHSIAMVNIKRGVPAWYEHNFDGPTPPSKGVIDTLFNALGFPSDGRTRVGTRPDVKEAALTHLKELCALPTIASEIKKVDRWLEDDEPLYTTITSSVNETIGAATSLEEANMVVTPKKKKSIAAKKKA